MIPKDVFQKVRRIQITTSRMVTDVFAGQYHSVFKGRGMEFDEVREYQPGDDIRSIDWNVTARTGRPHIKKYVEERELSVMILVDASASCQFATVNQLKSRLAAEIASLLAFSAIRNNDKVGLVIFTDRVEKYLPARKGLKNVLRVVREVLYFQPRRPGTDITEALEFLSKVTTRRCVVFVISDFLEPPAPKSELVTASVDTTSLRTALSIADRRHDVIAVTLTDPREKDLPDCGLITIEDAETGEQAVVDTSEKRVREIYRQEASSRLQRRNRLFASVGVDHIELTTDAPYLNEMVKFFLKRRRRLRHAS
ncbi:MAG: DUF58 domain-containing protein [Candidatus Omnitrophota bacterium]|nr:DUF58 domain-containing protein [Candidatus Omnitrophota bacterium]MDZ4243376.1 DUF58 domain-containing protein [Candidatus Omnitrophota bacterium]